MGSLLLPLLRSPNRGVLDGVLAESVRFHSPVADYDGRADVAHLLSLIASVVSDLRATRELTHGYATTTFITGRVQSHALDGVLDERLDEHGRLVEATLLLRPLGALRVAIEAMRAGFEEDPLPSRGS
jgi:hypothetical protein